MPLAKWASLTSLVRSTNFTAKQLHFRESENFTNRKRARISSPLCVKVGCNARLRIRGANRIGIKADAAKVCLAVGEPENALRFLFKSLPAQKRKQVPLNLFSWCGWQELVATLHQVRGLENYLLAKSVHSARGMNEVQVDLLCIKQKNIPKRRCFFVWCGWQDLNLYNLAAIRT